MPITGSASVVGAGPAGLAAAIALSNAGVAVDVIEARADSTGVDGAELVLTGPIIRALDVLGVADDVAAAGIEIKGPAFYRADGSEVAAPSFPPAHRHGLPPAIGIMRRRLREILAAAATAAGVSIRNGVRVRGVEQDDTGVSVLAGDEHAGRYDFLIGADGVFSAVRDSVWEQTGEPRPIGQVMWRARVPRRTGPVLNFYGSGSRRAGLITVTDDYSYLFALENDPGVRVARDRFPELMRLALTPFGGAIADARDAVVDPMHVYYSAPTPFLLPRPWHRNRVLLIGDAAHATMPQLAYGAGLAVEDGVILGELARTVDDVEELMTRFTARRFERCRLIVDNGIQISRWEQNPDAPGAASVELTIASHRAMTAPI